MFFDNLFDDFDPFGTYTYRQPRKQASRVFRNDNHSMILRKIQDDEYNYMCFDCHRELDDLDYFDLKNGIFLCCNCAQQHARLSKEITQPMTGKIRALDEKDLLILYYGGNKNLYDFIKRHYPLLENMQIKEKYATKAMDYYRKLLRSKIYDESEPNMPGKKKAYTSIFQKKASPAREPKNKNIRQRRIEETERENDEDDINNILRSTFFGDDLYNRNKRKARQEEDDYLKTEPADINKKDEDETDGAGMKVQPRKNSYNNENEEKEVKTQRTVNHEVNHQKKEENEEKMDNDNIKVNTSNTLTINQIGELSTYPDALEIDGMESECECQ